MFALINDKGGVGKTTLASNLAGQLAAAGKRVLLIDLNRQANCAEDLGYRGREGVDDQGAGLLMALLTGQPLRPVRDIRPNLDVVPGGRRLADLSPMLTSRFQSEGRRAFLALAVSLIPIAEEYDAIIIDSPPENVTLEDLTLATARYAIMPTKSDKAGLIGMELTAERFTAAQEVNPWLQLLGVVLFATLSSGTYIQAKMRRDVEKAFGADPMLDAVIRYAERLAVEARDRGLLAHELAAANIRGVSTETAQGVAADFHRLTDEVLTLLAAAEADDDEMPEEAPGEVPGELYDQNDPAAAGPAGAGEGIS